ncbi:MAG: hypothetical protein ABI284_08645 [Nitrosospira sp.]
MTNLHGCVLLCFSSGRLAKRLAILSLNIYPLLKHQMLAAGYRI